jgi:hypothetical protein
MGNKYIDPRIFDMSLVEGEWSASRLGRFTSRESVSDIY